MARLPKAAFEETCAAVIELGRPLEAALLRHYFFSPCPEQVLGELKKYQNPDGGFGNGLEPDFLAPVSSPMDTSVAFQWLIKFDKHPAALKMIKDQKRALPRLFNLRSI